MAPVIKDSKEILMERTRWNDSHAAEIVGHPKYKPLIIDNFQDALDAGAMPIGDMDPSGLSVFQILGRPFTQRAHAGSIAPGGPNGAQATFATNLSDECVLIIQAQDDFLMLHIPRFARSFERNLDEWITQHPGPKSAVFVMGRQSYVYPIDLTHWTRDIGEVHILWIDTGEAPFDIGYRSSSRDLVLGLPSWNQVLTLPAFRKTK